MSSSSLSQQFPVAEPLHSFPSLPDPPEPPGRAAGTQGTNEEPLNAEHYEQLQAAERLVRRLSKAAGVARFNGWSIGGAALLSLPFATSLAGLTVALGLSVLAFNEFRGRRQLLAFHPQSTRLLGWNQVAFLGLIVAYCGYSLSTLLGAESTLLTDMGSRAELESVLGSLDGLERLYRQVVVIVYVSLALLSVLFQGGNAWYYFARTGDLDQFLEQTPAWIRKMNL